MTADLLAEMEALAARTREAIHRERAGWTGGPDALFHRYAHDLARLDADLDHLRDALAGLAVIVGTGHVDQWPYADLAHVFARQRDRAAASIRATAAAHGVTTLPRLPDAALAMLPVTSWPDEP